MFGTPVRDTESSAFIVPLTKPIKANVLLELTIQGLVSTLSYQEQLQSLKTSVVQELTKCHQLFKNPPTVSSLLAITPNWGFIKGESGVQLSPYTRINVRGLDSITLPCMVDLVLESVSISPATLSPIFGVEIVKTLSDVIDFEWTPVAAKDELEEVSDVTNTEDGTLTLTNPAETLRVKLAAKERVREAFRTAQVAHNSAVNLANSFMDEFDLSDSESAFSEWMSEDDDE
jgi:hypothetical protein